MEAHMIMLVPMERLTFFMSPAPKNWAVRTPRPLVIPIMNPNIRNVIPVVTPTPAKA